MNRVMTRTNGLVVMAVAIAMTVAACVHMSTPIGIKLRGSTQFESNWNSYTKLPMSKAFALAGGISSKHVSGLAWGKASAEDAAEEAMRFCEERRRDRRITEACHLYALGDHIVAEAAPSG